MTIPQSAETGRWQIEGIGSTTRSATTAASTGRAEQAGINASFDVASSSADTTPPVISDVSVQPASIDVSSAAQTVTFSATITDAGVGVCGAISSACQCSASDVFVSSPSGNQTKFATWHSVGGDRYTAE